VLFGNTTIGADVASVLSSRLSLLLVSSCVHIDDGKITSKICGGKIMAECELGVSTTLITVNPGNSKVEQGQGDKSPVVETFSAPILDDLRVTLKEYIEPETGDVDISKEPILISVGRGIQTEDNIELAEQLAELLGGTVCSSRPIVDQGWLPTSRMVGKSGKNVKPKLYIALGISGAPEHVEGMADSEMIVAINMDPNAPIFDIATYGVEFDFFDLIDPLLEKVEEAKEGMEVAISVPGVNFERQMKTQKLLYSDMSESQFKTFKKNKDLLSPNEIKAIQDIAEIKRQEKPEWGV